MLRRRFAAVCLASTVVSLGSGRGRAQGPGQRLPIAGGTVGGGTVGGEQTAEGAGEAGFVAFLASVRAEAVAGGISAGTVDRAFANLRPNPRVLELDSRAPEFTQTWDRYRSLRVTDQRVEAGRRLMQAHAGVLEEVRRRFGVPPGIVVAIWGVETNYGAFTGGFSVIQALATLAADGRRDGFFRRELLDALRILDHEDIALPRMTGSYAGAMGQPQFMPSSYLAYAVSYDGGPRRDIWDKPADALASIGNYLQRFGWRAEEPWGQRVRVPAGFDAGPNGRDDMRALAAWRGAGVTRLDGAPLSHPAAMGAVITPDGAAGEAFMVYGNFMVIRRYNRSDLYALSVGVLADRLSGSALDY